MAALILKRVVTLRGEKVESVSGLQNYVGLEHIESHTGRASPNVAGDSAEGAGNIYQPGDVLFGKLRPYLAKAWLANVRGVCTTEALVLQARGIDASYLRYFLLASETISAVDASTSGAKMPRADWDFVGSLPVPVPGISAQVAIAHYLDTKTAAIDGLITKKEGLIEELKKYQEAVITESVLGVRQQESKVKAGEAADVFAGYSKYTLLPAKRLFQRKKQLNEGMACTNRLSLTMSGVIPRDLNDAHGLQAAEYETYQRVEQGDLLFKLIDLENIKTSRVGLVPAAGIVSPAYIRLSRRHSDLDVEYFYWYFYALYLNNVFNSMGGGVRQALGPTELLDILIPVPPTETRAKIVLELTAKVAQLKAVVDSAAKSVTELKNYRTALISEAVTGKLNILG